jgi:hypothetical protein
MPYLARHLQNDFLASCPQGWTCQTEVKVVPAEVEQWLGYAPQADAMFQEVATGRRVWVELEISRADPVANHAKFATAHLLNPLPPQDTFVSMVSRHVDRGRSNLCAHTIGLMRAIGLRAFQTPLLPAIESSEIKRLNHLEISRLREEPLQTEGELRRMMSVSSVLGRALDNDIHFAANAVEVVYNIHRWNKDMSDPEQREHWGLRRVRYIAHDPRSGLFAPSKFASYVQLPDANRPVPRAQHTLTGMTVQSYAAIDYENPLFDGRRAWQHLEQNLGMQAQPLEALPAKGLDAFWRWAERHQDALQLDAKGAVILSAPQWAY